MSVSSRSVRRKRWGAGEGRAARMMLAGLIRIRQNSWKSDFSAGMARGYAASFVNLCGGLSPYGDGDWLGAVEAVERWASVALDDGFLLVPEAYLASAEDAVRQLVASAERAS